ncbi:DUF2771 family protein [Nocardia stercoris]|uniref:DUF2771 family protein n=1 Tax=Nocardia stercoris TaxID=2483361 RepID=A0A3M2KVU3_9NOCA|nr:DUF2771 family protein [Nocardia stercoris]
MALAAAAVLVVIVTVAGVVTVAVHRHKAADPELTVYAYGQAQRVPPFRYCDPHKEGARILLDCRQSGYTAKFDVPAGYPLQVSLPSELVDAPWHLALEYTTDNGPDVRMEQSKADYPAGTAAFSIKSSPQPDMHLVHAELNLLAPVVDETGQEGLMVFQAWSIDA